MSFARVPDQCCAGKHMGSGNLAENNKKLLGTGAKTLPSNLKTMAAARASMP